MRGQQGRVVRGWGAAAAAAVLIGSLAGCGADDAEPRVARIAAESATPETDVAVMPAASTTGLKLPEWLPSALPLPEGASLTAVGTSACTVSFLVPTGDAQVEGAAVGSRARANGLQVKLISSVTTAAPVEQPMDEFGEPVEAVAPVMTHIEVLRLRDGGAVDATLTLTSRGDGVVSGQYELTNGTCAR